MSRAAPWLAALAGVALGALAILWWQGRAPAGRAGTERIVHDYLLAHPEVIPEAMTRLQERDTGRIVAANRAAIVTPVGDAWTGNPKGDVTVVEYFDYNCGFCRASLPVVRALVAGDPDVRIVYRELPVLAETSHLAARASLLAASQGRFTRFHDALYAAGPVTEATIAGAIRAAGVDPARAAADQPGEDEQLRTNLGLAQRLGMTGTPSWVVGSRVLVGALSLDQMRAAVAEARGR